MARTPAVVSAIVWWFAALDYDCSTLGGNSGSPLVDIETTR